jgi:hypothetical protein
LKTSNFIKGKYMAELTQELMRSLEDTKYQSAEYRISIYGRSPDEWTQLASWFIDNKIHSDNVRYFTLIQCATCGCSERSSTVCVHPQVAHPDSASVRDLPGVGHAQPGDV